MHCGGIPWQEARRAHCICVEDLLWKTITPKRWTLLKAMVNEEPMAIREIARRVKRDVRAVHSDVQALLKAAWYFRTLQFMWISCCARLDISAQNNSFEQ